MARTVKSAATADPKPLTEPELARMVRITPVKRLRIELGLSQTEFAERFHIPSPRREVAQRFSGRVLYCVYGSVLIVRLLAQHSDEEAGEP